MSEPQVEYLPTKDGKKTPQELAISTDLAKECTICNRRKTMFLKAAICHICKLLWFMGPIERIGPVKELNTRVLASFSELEILRREWIIKYTDHEDTVRYWNEWIKEKSEDMYIEWTKQIKWTSGGTAQVVNKL